MTVEAPVRWVSANGCKHRDRAGIGRRRCHNVELGANPGSRRETVRDGFSWSHTVESDCEATTFNRCPTGGQVVAGSNPVSSMQQNVLRPEDDAMVADAGV
jgi:hypothetical protein